MTKPLPALLAVLLLTGAEGQESAPDLAREVQAIFKAHCIDCHGPKKSKGRFRLDSRTLALKGGLSSRDIVPGKSRESRLLQLVQAADAEERMPQDAPALPATKVDLLRRWIDQGAPWPDGASDAAQPAEPYWAYRKPVRAAPPCAAEADAGWARNPIDLFVAAARRARGLQPRPEAPRTILLRRVTLDLIGLPPTLEELRDFAADGSPIAYEKAVDRLLSDPRYGERWGRHWMDVWRYSDWAGWKDQVRSSRRHVWRWRDWIVESMNADKGYDRMILEMLAGDEIAPEDPQILRATGFLARSYHVNRNSWLEAAVEHTGKAFLGTTFNCARCHDHMYDPVSQEDYYRFRAFFEPYRTRTDRIPGESDTDKDGIARVFDQDLDAPTYLFLRGDDRRPEKSRPLAPATPAALGGGTIRIQPVELPSDAVDPDHRPFVIRDLLAAEDKRLSEAQAKIAAAGAAKEDRALAALDAAISEARRSEIRGTATPRQRAALETAKALITAQRSGDRFSINAALEKFSKEPDAPAMLPTYPATSTGRRTALARWIASPENPLTARVAVNHLWARHFGKGLVSNLFDFGAKSKPPSHPELLDWLATELVLEGWSLKKLHRLMVTSSAYRMASSDDPASAAIDPENRFLWRMNQRRMEAEVVRDTVLYVGGTLDLMRGGPEIDQNEGLTNPRRSIYFRHAQERQVEFLTIFDAAQVGECYERPATIVPQQALSLFNSALVQDQSRLLTRRLPEPFVRSAYETLLGRVPTPEETAACETFLADQARRLQDFETLSPRAGEGTSKVAPADRPDFRARESLVLVLMNHNDFVTIR